MNNLPDNPIQCPDDLEHLSAFNEHLCNDHSASEPSDDWNYLQHVKEGQHLAGYSRKEIKECQFEVEQRLADQAAQNAEIERDVENMRKFYANTRFL
mgnify:CR=1 FL=1|tara:strand:- start:1097 stop:1387 length:291 start_codon:yes stop_codon:yes gene_type:complete